MSAAGGPTGPGDERRTGTEPATARSALNLRLALVLGGLVIIAIVLYGAARASLPLVFWAFLALGVVALVDLIVVLVRIGQRRRREGAGADHSLFE